MNIEDKYAMCECCEKFKSKAEMRFQKYPNNKGGYWVCKKGIECVKTLVNNFKKNNNLL